MLGTHGRDTFIVSLFNIISLSGNKPFPLLGILALVVLSFYIRHRITSSTLENQLVASLVQESLDTLQTQEYQHHVDPVTTPYPHISSNHLRDLLLRDEHSGAKRIRVWQKVEKIVEGNANVRSGVEELNGEECQ